MTMPSHHAASSSPAGRGFTLLELILTIAILALITGIIGGAFRLVVRSWEKGEAEVEAFRRARLVLDRVGQQLKSTYPYWIEENNDWKIAFNGEAHALDFIAPLSLQSHLITGLVSVHYALEASDSGEGFDFVAQEAKVVDQKSARESFGGLSQDKSEAVLLAGIMGLTFEYYVIPEDAAQGDWRPSWTWEGRNEADGILPHAVRLTLKQKPHNPDDEPLVTAMTIPLVTNSSQDFAIAQKKMAASQFISPEGISPAGLPLPGAPPPIPGAPATGGPNPPGRPFDAPVGPAQRPPSTPFDGGSRASPPPAGGHSTPFEAQPGAEPRPGSTPFN